jgi:hypothetical protein
MASRRARCFLIFNDFYFCCSGLKAETKKGVVNLMVFCEQGSHRAAQAAAALQVCGSKAWSGFKHYDEKLQFLKTEIEAHMSLCVTSIFVCFWMCESSASSRAVVG